jgi:hypothetical protein
MAERFADFYPRIHVRSARIGTCIGNWPRAYSVSWKSEPSQGVHDLIGALAEPPLRDIPRTGPRFRTVRPRRFHRLDWTCRDHGVESADILVLPSYAEGMVIENEITGLLVEPGNVADLGQALSRVVEDQGLRNRLGAEAARVFASKLDAASYPDRMRPNLRIGFRHDRRHSALCQKG